LNFSAAAFDNPYEQDSILLGYSSLSQQDIKVAVRAMVRAVDELDAGQQPIESRERSNKRSPTGRDQPKEVAVKR